MVQKAVEPFYNSDIRIYIENVRKSHEQMIDNVNIDKVVNVGFDMDVQAKADNVIQSFQSFIGENKDEIIALRIIYDQRYTERPMAIEKLKILYEKFKSKGITVEHLWDCYAIKQPEKVKKGTLAKLTDLISIIRFEIRLPQSHWL